LACRLSIAEGAGDMIARHSLFGVIFACTGICVMGAFAQPGGRPVAAKDFSGKNVCWNEGRRDVYGADGKFTSYSGHHTTWSVPEPGVLKRGSLERQVELLPDGRFHMHYFSGGDRDFWGAVCN
jgi:hypothetical protein